MNINNVKIGDWVKIVDRGLYRAYLNGKVGVVIKTNNDRIVGIDIKGEGLNLLAYKSFELLLEHPSIHITTDGIETYAVLKEDGKVIKKSIAKCSPYDEFNFEDGVKIAVDRLFEEKKEDKNNFSVVFGNDWTVIIKKGKVYDFVNGYTTWDSGDKSLKYDNFDDLKKYKGAWKPFKIKKVKRQAKVGEYIQIIGGIKVINKEGETTQSGDICIHHYGGYEWFKNINNDMEIMLTNMHKDTPEYLVLEGYEKYIEYIEKKKKAEFKPHLISSFSGSFYGNIGKESSQVDVLGNRLNVGDTVDLYYGTEPRYETSVVKYANVKTDFVMGLSGIIFSNGKCGDWTIVKNRSYEDVQNGETVGSIKYIKNDPSKAKISTYKY